MKTCIKMFLKCFDAFQLNETTFSTINNAARRTHEVLRKSCCTLLVWPKTSCFQHDYKAHTKFTSLSHVTSLLAQAFLAFINQDLWTESRLIKLQPRR